MLHIFTLGNNINEMECLKRSAAKQNVNINYILFDQWNGYVDKIIHMKNAIRDIPHNDIVCFIDAYDVLLFSDENEILEKFKEYNCELLLSGELNCYPGENIHRYNNLYSKLALDKMTNFRYVNSGGYIGYKHAIQSLYDWKSIDEIQEISKLGGDQNYFTEYFLNHGHDKEKVKIDMFQHIFQSMYKIHFEGIEFVNGRLYNNVLKVKPCFVHFNGYGGYYYQIYRDIYREDIRQFFLRKIDESKDGGVHNLNGYRPPYQGQFANIDQL
jgi:hypothetical protein